MKKEYLILIAILVFAFIFRIYRLSEMVGFDFDQEYAAIFASQVLNEYPIRFIGQGLSVQGLFMGPLYFYFLVPFFAAFNLAPIGGYIGSVILGLVIIGSYFYTLKKIFGVEAGLIAAFLRAILFGKIQADWTMAPSYSSELLIIWTWYSFYKYWNGSYKYILSLGFIFGLYTSFHPILFPFYLVFLAIFILKRKKPKLKYIFFSIILFLIPLSPLILFEYFHKFLEVKLLFSLKGTSGVEIKTVKTLFDYFLIIFNYPSTIFGINFPGILNSVFSAAFYLLSFVLIFKKVSFWKDNFHPLIVVLTITLFLGYYFLLPTHVPPYYFLGIEVVVFIYTVAILSLLKNKRLILITLTILFVINLSLLYNFWQRSFRIALANKEAIVKEIAKRNKDNNINIYYNIDNGQQYGFGYLIRYYKIDPKGGNGVPDYTIVLPISRIKDKINISSGEIGLLIKN